MDAHPLVQELGVHQPELELQNEELHAARQEIETGLARYTELFDFAPVGFLVVGPDRRIRAANLAAARLVGVERALLPGRALAELVSARDVAAFSALVGDVLADRPPPGDAGGGRELSLRLAPSGTVDVRATAVALAGAGGTVLVALEDVTARRRAERALWEESRRKDDFLAALSHELRSPLAPIRNGLGLLARASPGTEQAGRALAVVERQVGHLSRMVDDLLDVTRLARGLVRLERRRVELGGLVQRTVEDHRATFDSAGIALRLRLSREPAWVDVDPTRFAQVLGNLLENAAKFTSRDGRVDVVVARKDGHGAVTVRDTGVGIAPDVRSHLFEPFCQAPQALDRGRGGLGLGLATVKGLVELHGGSVSLSSEGPGCGAEFTVRFPAAAPPPERRPTRLESRRGGRRILVIDDNEDGAITLKEILELEGNDVRVAFDGPRGLALARAFEPEVVVCDIGLPGMDGYAVARALRADPATRGAYLVALSGYALPDDVRRAREAGFDRHLAKPLVLDALERALVARRAPAASPAAQPGAH